MPGKMPDKKVSFLQDPRDVRVPGAVIFRDPVTGDALADSELSPTQSARRDRYIEEQLEKQLEEQSEKQMVGA